MKLLCIANANCSSTLTFSTKLGIGIVWCSTCQYTKRNRQWEWIALSLPSTQTISHRRHCSFCPRRTAVAYTMGMWSTRQMRLGITQPVSRKTDISTVADPSRWTVDRCRCRRRCLNKRLCAHSTPCNNCHTSCRPHRWGHRRNRWRQPIPLDRTPMANRQSDPQYSLIWPLLCWVMNGWWSKQTEQKSNQILWCVVDFLVDFTSTNPAGFGL